MKISFTFAGLAISITWLIEDGGMIGLNGDSMFDVAGCSFTRIVWITMKNQYSYLKRKKNYPTLLLRNIVEISNCFKRVRRCRLIPFYETKNRGILLAISSFAMYKHVMFCAIWYHLYNLKCEKHPWRGLLLVKLQVLNLQIY